MTLATTPCPACPYRKDAPRGFWDRTEFLNTLAQDHQHGHMFGCHLNPVQRPDTCVGWLADQKRRGVRNIGLRLSLLTSKDQLARFEAVDENAKNLYPSIEAMVDANIGKKFPAKDAFARGLLRKLVKAKR